MKPQLRPQVVTKGSQDFVAEVRAPHPPPTKIPSSLAEPRSHAIVEGVEDDQVAGGKATREEEHVGGEGNDDED